MPVADVVAACVRVGERESEDDGEIEPDWEGVPPWEDVGCCEGVSDGENEG